MSATNRPDDSKQKFRNRFIEYFDSSGARLVDFAAIEQQVTFNFDDDDRDRIFLQRFRSFVALLLRTKEMDQS